MQQPMRLILGLACTSAVCGATVYDNGAPDYLSGAEMTRWLQADDFYISANTHINSATFSLLATGLDSWDGTIEWFIFDAPNGNGGYPGDLLASGNAQSIAMDPVGIGDYYDVQFDFGQDVQVEAQRRYFFGLHMASDYDSSDGLYWGTTSDVNPDHIPHSVSSFQGTQDNWFNSANSGFPTDLSFTLVPAPSTLGLLALSTLVSARRRRDPLI